ncbi:50S ribosomal protein L11 [candidate division WOR-3 bacterium]|nr:50S ribosomal protein L11 [candidate division WOR-3 bacterium]
MAKEIIAKVKIYIPGGQATPAPPVGTSLGPHGINIPMFCKSFNEQTKGQEEYIIPAIITIYSNRTFDFILKTPPTSMLLKRAAGIAKASGEPNKNKVAKINRSQVEDIAKKKLEDLNVNTLESAVRVVEGTARSMGIEVGSGEVGSGEVRSKK